MTKPSFRRVADFLQNATGLEKCNNYTSNHHNEYPQREQSAASRFEFAGSFNLRQIDLRECAAIRARQRKSARIALCARHHLPSERRSPPGPRTIAALTKSVLLIASDTRPLSMGFKVPHRSPPLDLDLRRPLSGSVGQPQDDAAPCSSRPSG